MKRTLTVVIALMVVVVAVLVGTRAFRKPIEGDILKIRVGYLSLASSLPFFVAKENGYFRDEGITVEAFNLHSSNEAADALLANRVDATSVAALSVWMAIEQQQPDTLKTFLMTYTSDKTTVHRILVKPGSSIKTLGDLKGTTLGTFPGLQMKVFTKLILGKYFDTTDLEIVPLSPPLQKDALASGRIDALFCLEPVGTIAEDAGIGVPIAVNPLYEYILKPFPTAASVVSTKFLKEQPEAARRYVKAIYRVMNYIAEHSNEVRKLLSKYTSLTVSQKVGIYDFWTSKTMDRTAVQKLADLYVEHGILKGKLDTKRLYLEMPQ